MIHSECAVTIDSLVGSEAACSAAGVVGSWSRLGLMGASEDSWRGGGAENWCAQTCLRGLAKAWCQGSGGGVILKNATLDGTDKAQLRVKSACYCKTSDRGDRDSI